MSYKVMINAFAYWLPFNHKYYRTREEAERVANSLITNRLAGNSALVKVVKVSEHESIF